MVRDGEAGFGQMDGWRRFIVAWQVVGYAVERAMSNKSGRPMDDLQTGAEDLSALVDGEIESTELSGLLAQWRNDEDTRARWHGYQLIGDVLRSEDLASTAHHDRDFMAKLRLKLDAEPVVLAPSAARTVVSETPSSQPFLAPRMSQRRWGRWGANAAMAAGLAIVVVGAVNVLRPASPAAELAEATQAPALTQQAQATTADPAVQVLNGRLIRDARLDSYLAAHQQLSGGSMLGGQSAYVRRAAAEMPER